MRYLVTLIMVAALLTGCSNSDYVIENVKVVKKESADLGRFSKFTITIEHDGSNYSYIVNSESFNLVKEGSFVDVHYHERRMDTINAKLTPAITSEGEGK